VSTRTATRQEAPYRPLSEATEDESEQTFPATAGVLVGFRTPDYEQGISVAGYHLHFLNEDHTAGGHAFDFLLDEGVVEMSTVSEMQLSLPTSGPFSLPICTGRTWRRTFTRARDERDGAPRSSRAAERRIFGPATPLLIGTHSVADGAASRAPESYLPLRSGDAWRPRDETGIQFPSPCHAVGTDVQV